MAKTLRQKLRERLSDPDYRHAYADESLNATLASQIRVLREQRDLNQSQLASAIGTKQSGVSRLESAEYEGWSIRTLKKLAQAFDVRLRISFEPFGTLWRDIAKCDREHLARPSFDEDPEFRADEGTTGPAWSSDAGIFYRTDSSVRDTMLRQERGKVLDFPLPRAETHPGSSQEAATA